MLSVLAFTNLATWTTVMTNNIPTIVLSNGSICSFMRLISTKTHKAVVMLQLI